MCVFVCVCLNDGRREVPRSTGTTICMYVCLSVSMCVCVCMCVFE